ncbi:uncharacterized protein LOC144178076 [Haemaphysalis longicornis]
MYHTCPLTGTGQYLSEVGLECCTTTPAEHSKRATMKASVILFLFALLVGVALADRHYRGYGGHGKSHGGHHGGYGRKHGGHGHKGGHGHGGHKGVHHYGGHGYTGGRHYG